MKSNVYAVQRPLEATNDNNIREAREMAPRGDRLDQAIAANRRETAGNRVEALLQAHPSIVHEID